MTRAYDDKYEWITRLSDMFVGRVCAAHVVRVEERAADASQGPTFCLNLPLDMDCAYCGEELGALERKTVVVFRTGAVVKGTEESVRCKCGALYFPGVSWVRGGGSTIDADIGDRDYVRVSSTSYFETKLVQRFNIDILRHQATFFGLTAACNDVVFEGRGGAENILSIGTKGGHGRAADARQFHYKMVIRAWSLVALFDSFAAVDDPLADVA